MTFSAWMPIQSAGYSGPLPYSVFVSGFTRYDAAWQRPEWRYDRATGYIEYRGLVRMTSAVAVGNLPMILTYLTPSPGLPKPTENFLLKGMSNAADRAWGQPFRLDIQPHASAHHAVHAPAGGAGLAVDTWIWLELLHSASDSDPLWYPWREPGVNADGVLATYGAGWSKYAAGWNCGFRFTRDYKRWQWRALLKGPTLAAAPPYDNIVTVTHPTPQTIGNTLNICLINRDWAGGSAIGIRVDNRQNAGGHRLDVTGGTAGVVPAYFGVIMDYFVVAQ
jgi:hypothetical protein